MLSLTLNIDYTILKQQLLDHVAAKILKYKTQADKTFVVFLSGVPHTLQYDIDEAGCAIIYYAGSSDPRDASVVTPTLKLNVGQFMLPATESLTLPDKNLGLNPDACQAGFYELWDCSIPRTLAEQLMHEIRKIGFFNAIKQK